MALLSTGTRKSDTRLSCAHGRSDAGDEQKDRLRSIADAVTKAIELHRGEARNHWILLQRSRRSSSCRKTGYGEICFPTFLAGYQVSEKPTIRQSGCVLIPIAIAVATITSNQAGNERQASELAFSADLPRGLLEVWGCPLCRLPQAYLYGPLTPRH
jgi:hypothetical protein